MTTFRLLATNCGLSLKETAAFLAMPEETASAYWKGKRSTPPQALKKLHSLDRRIQSLAMEVIKGFRGLISDIVAKPPSVMLKLLVTDKEAKSYQLPFASCHEEVVSRVLRNLPAWALERVKFVDRGEDVEIL